MSHSTYPAAVLRRRRRWPIFLPFALVVVLAVAWSGLWFYAASRASQLRRMRAPRPQVNRGDKVT